jgi:hypothetical protein
VAVQLKSPRHQAGSRKIQIVDTRSATFQTAKAERNFKPIRCEPDLLWCSCASIPSPNAFPEQEWSQAFQGKTYGESRALQ